MLLDIDHFKRVNDERGHGTGDHVIKELVTLAKSSIRTDDCFGRWGGEEFVLVCPLASTDSAFALAEKIRVAVASLEFDAVNPLRVTISIGIAMVRINDTFETALERADGALYQAKSGGRNRSILADAPKADR